METVICKKCKKENPNVISTCKYCGEKLPKISSEREVESRTRHGFVTFWLILLIIFNVIIALINFAPEAALGSSYSENPMWAYFMSGLVSLVVIMGSIMLLNWKMLGFYLVILAAIIMFLTNLFLGLITFQGLASPFITTYILYRVLLIKKNGDSCWEQLDDIEF